MIKADDEWMEHNNVESKYHYKLFFFQQKLIDLFLIYYRIILGITFYVAQTTSCRC